MSALYTLKGTGPLRRRPRRCHQLGLGPGATTSCSFAPRHVIHPGTWGVARGKRSSAWLPSQGHGQQQRRHAVYLCVHATHVPRAGPGGPWESRCVPQSRSRRAPERVDMKPRVLDLSCTSAGIVWGAREVTLVPLPGSHPQPGPAPWPELCCGIRSRGA